LGVVGIDIYMSAIERILGEEATSSTMLALFVALSTASCPKIELSACELDALRFLGGGDDATCEVCNDATCEACNRTNYAGIIPKNCSFQSDLPNNLWNSSSKLNKVFVIWM
jgi:hypothetical protein